MGDATVRDAAASSPRALVIFDYDWSLVNENSDTLVFHSLCPDLVAEIATRRREQPSWTQLMDDLLGELVVRQPLLSQEQIQDAVARIPVQPRMLDALRMAVETFGAHVQIVSDANTVYIESMLAHHDLHAYVKRVVTNPAVFEPGTNRLRVRPYHALEQPPHGCALCPTNMCKGRILDAIRTETAYDIVLYVGDGGGDFCPATRLTSRDVVFARDDDADGKPYGLLKKIRAAEDGTVQARVVPWRTGHDIYEQFTLALQANSQ